MTLIHTVKITPMQNIQGETLYRWQVETSTRFNSISNVAGVAHSYEQAYQHIIACFTNFRNIELLREQES